MEQEIHCRNGVHGALAEHVLGLSRSHDNHGHDNYAPVDKVSQAADASHFRSSVRALFMTCYRTSRFLYRLFCVRASTHVSSLNAVFRLFL